MVKGDCRPNSIGNQFPPTTGGNQRPCRDAGVGAIVLGLAMLKKASALYTLIHQRHPTPSCGGQAPTAERTMNPARTFLESLDRRPGIRERPRPRADHHQNFEVLIRRRVSLLWKYCLGRVKDNLGYHRHRGRFARARSRSSRRAKDVAQSVRVCLTELLGRGNSEAIAGRSLFAIDL
jgi:hypothetical protein